jgi:catechol 2,3-dioxygenase-like lactoylglutathione lyase family enzyme
MEVNKNPNMVACQSAQHFEAVVDAWMGQDPWKGMDRNEARRIIAGLNILVAQRVPVDVDYGYVEFSESDIEEAGRLCDEAEAQGRVPFGVPIPRRIGPAT